MPREWIDFAIDQSERTRSEFIDRLAGELARSLETIDLAEIVERVLDGKTLEVTASLRLRRDADARRGGLKVSLVDGGKRR